MRRWDCTPLEGKGALNTAEWWRGAAPDRMLFTVPVEPDGSCDYWAIYRLCQDLGRHPNEAGPDN